MKTDLHELLDRPLPGEPPARDADRRLATARRALRRRQWVAGAASVGGAAAVATLVLATSLTGTRPDGAAPQDASGYARSPASEPQANILPSIRARHPYAALIVDCLTRQGRDSTLSVDGGIVHEGTTDAIEDFQTAFDSCSRLTSSDWHTLYRRETATASCLRDLQQAVPPAPGFSTFVDRYREQDHWSSYRFVTARPGDGRWELLNTQCPQPTLG